MCDSSIEQKWWKIYEQFLTFLNAIHDMNHKVVPIEKVNMEKMWLDQKSTNEGGNYYRYLNPKKKIIRFVVSTNFPHLGF